MTCNPDRLVAVILAAALLMVGAGGAARGDEGKLAASAAAMRAGNVSLARRLATQAVADDPTSGPAHVAAAVAALAEGDGITAEGEISRATDAGVDARTTRHLYAHARLLQGDPAGALAAARTVDAANWTAGARIQARSLAATGDQAGAETLWTAATARSPGDAALWSDLGTYRLSQGNQAGAAAAAQRAIALGPDSLDALLLQARVVRGTRGLTAALPWYRAALKRDPNSYAALIDLAATQGDMGRATEMLATTRRALALRPGDPQAFYLLAVLSARAGNVPLARAMFDRTGDALRGVPAGLLLGATLDLQTGDLEQAAARLRNLLGLQPMNIRARQLLAVTLLRLNAVDDALDVLRPVALRDDADTYTLLLSARGFERTGRRAQAASLIDRAFGTNPGRAAIFAPEDSVAVAAATAAARPAGDLPSSVPLIRSLLENGDAAGAVDRARAAAAANAGSADAAVMLGDTLGVAGRNGDTIAAYRQAAALRFDEPTMLRLTRALDGAGDRAGAAAVLSTFLQQNPASIAARRLFGRAQVAGDDVAGAIDTLERLRARIGNRDASLLGELAGAYGAGGAWSPAVSYAAAAYRLAPASGDAAHLYGWTMYRSGQPRAALPLLAQAVRITPEAAMLRWHVAQVYDALGRRADAKIQAAIALRDPRFPDRAAAAALIAG